MATSTSSMPTILLLTVILLSCLHQELVAADEFFYDWTVSYALRYPLGVAKQVIVINNQFPGPLLNLITNDVAHVNVINKLDEPFLITWHGVQQRRNSWNDGVLGTNCPIPPGQSWTYSFQVKDQIGTYFYYPSTLLQKAAGGYGPIRVNNRIVIPIPFPKPQGEIDVLVGDWYNTAHKVLRSALDAGGALPSYPDGILINGAGPGKTSFTLQPGATYLLRISNVGLKTTINFRIQGHQMLVVETEGSYVVQEKYSSLDIHPGQSYSVLVTADQPSASYSVVASARFLDRNIVGTAFLYYSGSSGMSPAPLPGGPANFDYSFSINQARSIRWFLSVGAARPNPQGSFHYGLININRTIILRNSRATINNKMKYTVNDISFIYPDTPLKLADYFKIPNVFYPGSIPDAPANRIPTQGTPVIDAHYRDFIQIVFENSQPSIQTWHIDGYNFFVVGMDSGFWDSTKSKNYNLVDAVYRNTVQVYPNSWTAVLLELDNYGMWNIRSQDEERRYLGQELYMRVKGDDPIPSVRDEAPIPSNVITCGRSPAVH